eukprot:TRINITY_DN67522_c0_g1_i1.p1 TRINITY_DN67522_c0_g1~~TRINITY_DN67522_c0_g1_i1.p1  ORF type:complete len:323 (-),score=37.73 TRINITY_DN67522_c0_g1_i1:379-1347(-)
MHRLITVIVLTLCVNVLSQQLSNAELKSITENFFGSLGQAGDVKTFAAILSKLTSPHMSMFIPHLNLAAENVNLGELTVALMAQIGGEKEVVIHNGPTLVNRFENEAVTRVEVMYRIKGKQCESVSARLVRVTIDPSTRLVVRIEETQDETLEQLADMWDCKTPQPLSDMERAARDQMRAWNANYVHTYRNNLLLGNTRKVVDDAYASGPDGAVSMKISSGPRLTTMDALHEAHSGLVGSKHFIRPLVSGFYNVSGRTMATLNEVLHQPVCATRKWFKLQQIVWTTFSEEGKIVKLDNYFDEDEFAKASTYCTSAFDSETEL